MQLLIILALLLCGGASGGKMLSEVRPVLESLGGEEIKQALKSADELSGVISAVQAFAVEAAENSEDGLVRGAAEGADRGFNGGNSGCGTAENVPAIAFPLAPIANIADRDITYSLSRYFSA